MAQPPPLAEVAMYSECASLTESLQERSPPRIVLSSYPPAVGREVVRSVLPPLKGSSRLSPAGRETGSGEGEEQSPLQTREEVEWTMEVLGHGLQLPLSDHDLVSSCIAVYEDWLSAFSPSPSSTVPAPVVTDPNRYCLVILTHLYQLFTPREADSGSQLELHLQLCQKVLTLTKSLVMTSGEKLSEPTCEAVCRHLLSVADLLLSPPLDPFSLPARLSGQLTHVLFAAWLRACTAFFPEPHMWKSLRELCLRWRHHLCLATEWSSLMYSLTLRVVSLLYSPSYLAHLQDNLHEDSEFSEILRSIPPDSLVQAWFRLLHTLGNPVDLSSLSSLPLFQKVAGDHLSVPPAPDLPHIFYEALQGVARLVYLFLGLEPRQEVPRPPSEGSASFPPLSARPSPQGLRRKGSKEFRDKSSVSGSIGGGGGTKKSTIWYDVTSPRLPIVPQLTPLTSPLSSDVKRPRGNTILHLFGSWLFEAVTRPVLHAAGGERGRQTDSARPAVFRSLVDLNGSTDSTLTLTTPPEDHAQFEAGRAEAIGALCAIFSSQPCGEPFLPVYLARFYRCLHLGLKHDEASQGLVMTRILLNSPSLFRKGLPGLNLVLPSFLTALELVLPHPAPLVRCSVGTQELRHASIQILLSVFSLPLHFLQQPLPAMSVEDEEEEEERDSVTFYSLREWTLWLLFSAIEHERDGSNLQLLLHGVLVCLQDTVLYENVTTRLAEEGVGEGESGSARTEFFSSVVKDYGSASLFRRASKAAHWCLLQWQNKIHISLSALELLQGLAQLQFEYIDHEDLNMAVMWVCEYIHRRAEKDKILHSKDLHTSIVAAFSCLLSWVTLHPYLLGDKTILEAVMQVVELGISGTFSQVF
ncbi:Ral GTPase-activating protein subunit beta [Geodia barretti]|uniref:Ral GTPase-activating protein subunit beta n=1 Tax=Geodia barretti TaxID=519541 RepID=A0AA35WFP2_GEOBA|nr:Ral GTPase-activating protein subunit beta [Geodia barretti]